MSIKGKTIWYIEVDPAGEKSSTCIDEGFATFDINIHLIEELGGELQDFSASFRQHQKEEVLKEIYQNFDREFRGEIAHEFRDLEKGLNHSEGFQRIVHLNKKVVDFTSKMRNLDKIMHDFDEFERQERFKKIIIDRLMSVVSSWSLSWYDDVMRFMNEINTGDMVIMPLKEQSYFAVGKIKGEYQYRQIAPNIRHVRKTKWKKRSIFSEDLHSVLPLMQSVYKLDDKAEELVMKLIRDQWFLDRVE
ncbi:hypothetical protein [Methanolobus sp. WCC5]|uniref:hypothetical protein n=1 Tax=Methanolobus sp. WCC5 TaxID=3125785 RepID=UPI00324DC3F0